MANPAVAIYTITFNQRRRLKRTLEDLFAQNYPQDCMEIVVNNDGSSDETDALLADLKRQSPIPITIIHSERERNYMSAKRWNQCLAAVSDRAEVLIQIDDVFTRSDFVRQHVRWHDGDDLRVVAGAKFEGMEETWDLSACRRSSLAGPAGEAAEVESFTAVWGASLSFSRKLMETVCEPPFDNPYDERMEGWGFHEVELAYRMKKAGARIVYDPAAGVFHRDHTPSSESQRGLDRNVLVKQGNEQNVRYLLDKHGLEELPRW